MVSLPTRDQADIPLPSGAPGYPLRLRARGMRDRSSRRARCPVKLHRHRAVFKGGRGLIAVFLQIVEDPH